MVLELGARIINNALIHILDQLVHNNFVWASRTNATNN